MYVQHAAGGSGAVSPKSDQVTVTDRLPSRDEGGSFGSLTQGDLKGPLHPEGRQLRRLVGFC